MPISPHQICGDPTLFDIIFTDNVCRDYRSAKHDDPQLNVTYNAILRRQGIFKSPGKCYPSLAHSREDLSFTGEAVVNAVGALSA